MPSSAAPTALSSVFVGNGPWEGCTTVHESHTEPFLFNTYSYLLQRHASVDRNGGKNKRKIA